MAKFHVYRHPDRALRKKTPFLLDVQNDFIDRVASRVVIPLRDATAFGPRMRDLNPSFMVSGQEVVLDTTALAAFPASGLTTPVTSLAHDGATIVSALDTLFGSF
ncbi:MAG: CcdB family protein [Burkholderiales bacterium]|nr:CcdB family protein [Burkholderiales bacterium]